MGPWEISPWDNLYKPYSLDDYSYSKARRSLPWKMSPWRITYNIMRRRTDYTIPTSQPRQRLNKDAIDFLFFFGIG